MAITKLLRIKETRGTSKSSHLKNNIFYICNPEKTSGGCWIGGNAGTTPLPGTLKGVWRASLMSDGAEVIVNLSLESDGTMTLLREPPENYPPILAKGGYVLSRDSEDILTLCYLVSSPSQGTMPYNGCVKLWSDGTGMILEDKGEEFRYLLMMGMDFIGFEKIR